MNLNSVEILTNPDVFPSEIECKLIFKDYREKMGVKCKKCSNKKHYFLQAKWQWQCSKCCFRTTLRSGTALQNSKLSFQSWFLAIYHFSHDMKGISAKQFQRDLGMKRYQPAWSLLHKLRRAFIPHYLNNLHDKSSEIEIDLVSTYRSGKVEVSKFKNRLLWWNLKYWNAQPAPCTYSKLLMPVNKWGCESSLNSLESVNDDTVDLFWECTKKIHKWVSDKYLQNYLQIFRYLFSRKWTISQNREMILTRLMAY
ncbi:MAG: hypothetical protein KKH44_10440 [Bacteroidetes bacterium]|nr:hypothetical protein [Bacteroidota bacterium]